jgi:hypothetical protein
MAWFRMKKVAGLTSTSGKPEAVKTGF